MNGRLVNVSLCFMFGMKLDVRNVEKDIDRLKSSKSLIYRREFIQFPIILNKHMNNKELLTICGIGVAAVTTIVTGGIYLVKTKDKKKKNGRLKEDMEILGVSLENKGWWLSKECQARSAEIIKWVEKEAKGEEEVEKALKVIKEKHWMTKDYQNAFKTIYDWAKGKIQ